jgi:hypothetical protein
MIIITIVFSTLNIFYTKKDSTYNLIIWKGWNELFFWFLSTTILLNNSN